MWKQGKFELGQSTLANLYKFIEKFEFAVFIATSDDKIDIRGAEFTTARDNVIFEMGLFMGGLGVDRVIFMAPGNLSDFRVPCDMAGITYVPYNLARTDANISATINPACFKIRNHIQSKSKLSVPNRAARINLTHAGAICFHQGDEGIEYLLVKSTEGRTIFPKGDIKFWRDDGAADAAKRIAWKEAGARGRIVSGVSRHVNYYKEALSAVHRIEVFLFDTTQTIDVRDKFRQPTWFNLNEAITVITQQRDYNTSYELARTLEWADNEIGLYYASHDDT